MLHNFEELGSLYTYFFLLATHFYKVMFKKHIHTYQQYEDIHTGEEVLVDFMSDGAVNHVVLRHTEHHHTPL